MGVVRLNSYQLATAGQHRDHQLTEAHHQAENELAAVVQGEIYVMAEAAIDAATAAQATADSAMYLAGSKAKVSYVAIPPSNPAAGDIWFNTHLDADGRMLYRPYRFSGAAWVLQPAAELLVASEIAAGAIVADKIAAGAVIAGKIDAGAVTADELSADALQTSDYEYSGTINTSSEVATAGAKMQKATGSGNALLCAAASFKIGTKLCNTFGWIHSKGSVWVSDPNGYIIYDTLNLSSVTRVADGGTNMPAYKLRLTYSTAITFTNRLPVFYQVLHSGGASWTHRVLLVSLGGNSDYTDLGIWREDTAAWLDPTLANANWLQFHFQVVGAV